MNETKLEDTNARSNILAIHSSQIAMENYGFLQPKVQDSPKNFLLHIIFFLSLFFGGKIWKMDKIDLYLPFFNKLPSKFSFHYKVDFLFQKNRILQMVYQLAYIVHFHFILFHLSYNKILNPPFISFLDWKKA